MSETLVQPTAPQSSEEVSRIRDIIFGSQMRDYQQRFDAVQRDLDRLQQELDRLTEQLGEQDREQGKKLQALRREMRQADDALRDELRHTAQALGDDKVDRRALGDLFIQVGTQLQSGGSLADMLQGLIETEQD
jgi:predicted  nucleic acid-binding Zn-ribbon protein